MNKQIYGKNVSQYYHFKHLKHNYEILIFIHDKNNLNRSENNNHLLTIGDYIEKFDLNIDIDDYLHTYYSNWVNLFNQIDNEQISVNQSFYNIHLKFIIESTINGKYLDEVFKERYSTMYQLCGVHIETNIKDDMVYIKNSTEISHLLFDIYNFIEYDYYLRNKNKIYYINPNQLNSYLQMLSYNTTLLYCSQTNPTTGLLNIDVDI